MNSPHVSLGWSGPNRLIGLFICLAVFFVLNCDNNLFAQNAPRATQTKHGPVVGVLLGDAVVYKGLPYAAPPVGELRFAPPKDPEPWTEPLEAFRFSPMAYQILPPNVLGDSENFPRENAFSEDCLKLNIWTPATAKLGDKLPVYVFIHGGGFAIGSGDQPIFDGINIARQGVVVVTINYRLAALGFWPSKMTLTKYGTTGNWGLLDQIKALEWIKENIANFGGDPQKVTIGGESAGAMSVSALIVSPLAKGLFQRAILESGTIFSFTVWPFTHGELDQSLQLGSIMMSVLGLKDDEAGYKALQSLDPEILAELTSFAWDLAKPAPFGLFPVFDGRVLPQDPQKALAQGSFNQVKILIGFNRDEGAIFIAPNNGFSALKTALASFLGVKFAKNYSDLWPFPANDALDYTQRAVGWTIFTAGAKRFADLTSSYSDVYVYQFNYAPPEYRKPGLGAIHTIELPFVFGTLAEYGLENTPENKKISREAQSRWVNFIKNGDPNPQSVAKEAYWPKYDRNDPKVLLFDETVRNSVWPEVERLEFMADGLFGSRPQ